MNTRSLNPIRWLTLGLLTTTVALPAAALTDVESAGILYMKQEEKLARDVYQALAAQWSLPTFHNIAQSEQRHMNAIDTLIARYGLTDTTPAEVGRFSIPELQALYDELLTLGSRSVADALQAGVNIEEADIADLNEALSVTSDSLVKMVYGNLLRGSTQHLAAFQKVQAWVAAGNDPADPTLCPGGGLGKGQGCGAGPAAKGGRQGQKGQNGQGCGAMNGKGGKGPGNANQGSGICTQECPATCPTDPAPAPGNQNRRGGR